MRELKFRAWNKTDGYMVSVFLVSANGTFYQPARKVYDTPHAEIEMAYDELILMQYTGLKDKNGVDIYEGDILAVFDWGRTPDLLGRTQVIWCEDDCGWRYLDSLGADDFYDQFRNVLVIGNIHQHPELLEGGKE